MQLCQISTQYAIQVDQIEVNNDEDYRKLVDSIAAVKEAHKIAEAMRTAKVKYPNLMAKMINGLFKPLKEQLTSTREKMNRKATKYDDMKEAQVEAEKAARQLELITSETCESCGNRIGGVEEGTHAKTNLCYTKQNGIVTTVNLVDKACPLWTTRGAPALPVAGEFGTMENLPAPPGAPHTKTVQGEDSKLTMRKEWDFEITDMGKLVRAIGANAKTELVPEDLLAVKRSALLAVIRERKEANSKWRLAGCKLFQKKVPVSGVVS
jgi:hypothetical protein